MTAICFYFQVHQPFRLDPGFRFFQIGDFNAKYEHDKKNAEIVKKVARRCYIPMNALIQELIDTNEGRLHLSFSISGMALEQFELYAPEVLESFQKLVSSGCVELIGETYYHSLASVFSEKEFIAQIKLHRKKLFDLFSVSPTTFRNTELIYQDRLAPIIRSKGFKAILAEGIERQLGWRSPNFLYHPKNCTNMGLLLKNYRLSDDIAFRFSNRQWPAWPLTAKKFASWCHKHIGESQVINLFMDYETFGEHQWKETGIFDFFRHLETHILEDKNFLFKTPAEVVAENRPVDAVSFPRYVSWADTDRDLSAWLGNPLQDSSAELIYSLEEQVLATKNELLLHAWRKLQTSDHFYYMCTKWFQDGDVHKYFNPYKSPDEAYRLYNDVVSHMMEFLKSSF